MSKQVILFSVLFAAIAAATYGYGVEVGANLFIEWVVCVVLGFASVLVPLGVAYLLWLIAGELTDKTGW